MIEEVPVEIIRADGTREVGSALQDEQGSAIGFRDGQGAPMTLHPGDSVSWTWTTEITS